MTRTSSRIKTVKALVAIKLYLALACLPGLALAAEPDTSAIQQLTTILAKTDTLRASVEQLMLDQDGRDLQETQGTLVMRKPDHFYWETTEPFEQLMVTDGYRVWNYEPDLAQVTIQPFEGEVSRTPVLLLSGDSASIAAAFEVSVSTLPHNARQRFVLLPRDPGSLYERLSLTFYEDKIEEMQFEDSLGQKTSLSFRELEVNLPVDAGMFQFQIPPGIDVIDGL